MRERPVALAAVVFDMNIGRLTQQERRILGHMLRADSSKETARHLGLAVSTTKSLRSRVLSKMMASSAGELLVIAAEARAGAAARSNNQSRQD